MRTGLGAIIGALLVAAVLASLALFTVDQREHAIVFQLGEIKEVIAEPGLRTKWPLIQNVRYFDKRILTIDDPDTERFVTSEKKNLLVDAFVNRLRVQTLLAIRELHTQPTLMDKQVQVERYVGRARYVVYPWLVPELTFEYFNTELDRDMTYQLQGTVDVLVRANLKVWADVIGRRVKVSGECHARAGAGQWEGP